VQRHAEAAIAKDKLIFESLVDDHGAALGKYHGRVRSQWTLFGCHLLLLVRVRPYADLRCALQTISCPCYRHVLRPQDMVGDDR
jgi:hypothetical protein